MKHFYSFNKFTTQNKFLHPIHHTVLSKIDRVRLKPFINYKQITFHFINKHPFQQSMFLFSVVSNIIFRVLFISFSYSGTYYDDFLFCDFIILYIYRKVFWTVIVYLQGVGHGFLSFHRALFILFIQVKVFAHTTLESGMCTYQGTYTYL